MTMIGKGADSSSDLIGVRMTGTVSGWAGLGPAPTINAGVVICKDTVPQYLRDCYVVPIVDKGNWSRQVEARNGSFRIMSSSA